MDGGQLGGFLSGGLHALNRIDLAKPNKGRADHVGPFAVASQGAADFRRSSRPVSPRNRQTGGDICAPILDHAVYGIKLEFAQLGPLNSRIKRADDSAPHHVADKDEIVARCEHRRLAFELGRFALAENTRADKRPFGHLRQRVAAEFVADVVD